jgi:hypothetical protein
MVGHYSKLDKAANTHNPGLITSHDSATEVRVIPTDDEAMIAHHTRAALQGRSAEPKTPAQWPTGNPKRKAFSCCRLPGQAGNFELAATSFNPE